jgi:SAM-dependent methyltransferase
MDAIDMERLQQAYTLLTSLCQRYVYDMVHSLQESDVPVWHHKLLYLWSSKQQHMSEDHAAPADVVSAHPALWAEVQLAEKCGPFYAAALSGAVAYQELLFPGGSMEAVLPIYEDAVAVAFYNNCIVDAVHAVLTLLPVVRRVVVLEVGAGTGGTASSVLPVIGDKCEKYIFTDVSDFFLRQARIRFAEHSFIDYRLCNIDADPRLQGLAHHQCDIIIATNVLHATPSMRNTMHNCELLLRAGGIVVIN